MEFINKLIMYNQINYSKLIKLKSFCTMKETISKLKRQPSIANETTDKELICRIYKQLMYQLISHVPEKLMTQSKSGPKN